MTVEKMLPLGLAFIMLALGLNLKIADFTRLLKMPRPVFVGLFVQMVLLPVLAFVLLLLFPMRPAYAVGVMILAACPGGITSNMITRIARGDVALSITLTAITSLAGMITIPLIVGFALNWFTGETLTGSLPVGQMAMKVFAVATLPVLVGMAIHHLAPGAAQAMGKVVRPLSIVVFLLIVIWAFASSWTRMSRSMGEIGPVVILLNVLVMAAGWHLARLSRLGREQAIAIAIEGGLQNGALGIFVAVNLLHDPAMMTPSITYALVMNITVALFIVWTMAAVAFQRLR